MSDRTSRRHARRRRRIIIGMSFCSIVLLLFIAVIAEMYTSYLQANVFSRLAQEVTSRLETGASTAIRFPQYGPYDQRLGYTQIPAFVDRLRNRHFEVTAQTQWSPRMLELFDRGIFPVYEEKPQAGLTILDRDDHPFFQAVYPARSYTSFDDIPPLVAATLLFIENRELLDPKFPTKNPAIEWDRLAKAGLDYVAHKIDKSRDVTGGSTLATQLEKFRHSPEGRTGSMEEKLKQLVSASLRAYQQGMETTDVRKKILLNYINAIPLAAVPGYGEVSGMGDGLWFWYGADFKTVNRLLAQPMTGRTIEKPAEWAIAYRQVLSLFLAHRAPSVYLLGDGTALAAQTDRYLNILTDEGLLSPELRHLAMQARPVLKRQAAKTTDYSFVERKAANAIRIHLLNLLGLSRLYELDRSDATVSSTLDRDAQEYVIRVLQNLHDVQYADSASLLENRLIGQSDPGKVVYSLTLYERGATANRVRVQADNWDRPLDLNEGAKLELGSSAKLRTLVTYVEIIAALHQRYAGRSAADLSAVAVPAKDRLSRWALNYLSTTADTSVSAMLEAAMNRPYSSNPKERFFTGGGVHTFSNFDNKDFGGFLSVREAFYNSVNLVFIRMMRDIVNYYMYQIPGSSAMILDDMKDATRQIYLEKFADREGKTFLRRFYRKYQGKSLEESIQILLSGRPMTPTRLTMILMTIEPEASEAALADFLHTRSPNTIISDRVIRDLYRRYAGADLTLADRGYIARVHPLELWLVGYLRHHRNAKLSEVLEASTGERLEVYQWLFKTRRKNAQDLRIITMLETEAFLEIHRAWKRLGYPYDSLVPSYATAIGSSGDRPSALADLMGIILNDGVYNPTVRVERLHFGQGTPYETILDAIPPRGERVMVPEVAQVVKKALLGVVEQGTARRIHKAVVDMDGAVLPVGGKTGTGDNRMEIYSRQNTVRESRVINRTATFTFFIGDRFYGTLVAFVEGADAAQYRFTSGLPVQILKHIAPRLMPLLAAPRNEALSMAQPDADQK